jgi:5-methylthioadenosine/S-adenosylhomocysteine deaminase
MPDLLIHAAHVVRRVISDASSHVMSDAAILCRDGRIVAVDDFERLKELHPSASVIGGPGYIAMPGLVNGHFHVGVTPFQLGAPDLPLEEWGLAKMAIRYVDPYLDHSYAALQLIESGTTTVQLMNYTPRGHPAVNLATVQAVLRAYNDAGLRVAYAFNVVDQNWVAVGGGGGEREFLESLPASLVHRYNDAIGPQYRSVESIVELATAVFETVGTSDLVHATLGPSTVDRCSDDLLRVIRTLATEMQTTIHIHLQETIHQRRYAERTWGKTPLGHLHDLGFLGEDVTCGHAVWLTDPDIDLLAETGTRVCHNLSSNLRLSSGLAPLPSLLERGIRVSIGTDEAGINDDKDLFQEMRLVSTVHRAPFSGAPGPTAHAVFRMATQAGAASCSFGGETGTLDPGMQADVVLIRKDRLAEPFLHPSVSMVDAIVRRAQARDVDTVLVGGRVLMEGGRVKSVDRAGLLRALTELLSSPATDRELTLAKLSSDLRPHLVRFLKEGVSDFTPTPYSGYNSRA